MLRLLLLLLRRRPPLLLAAPAAAWLLVLGLPPLDGAFAIPLRHRQRHKLWIGCTPAAALLATCRRRLRPLLLPLPPHGINGGTNGVPLGSLPFATAITSACCRLLLDLLLQLLLVSRRCCCRLWRCHRGGSKAEGQSK